MGPRNYTAFYPLSSVSTVIRARWLRWTGHAAHMGKREGRYHQEDTDIVGRIILKWIKDK
jgi:hypothetical protein